MTAEYPIIDASSWELAGEETQGRNRHPWLRHETRDRTWLFKHSVPVPEHPLHEHMTEKIASEIAVLLGVPCAKVDLAIRHGEQGCLVEDLRWSKGDLVPGQLLLANVVEGYDMQHKQHHGHSLANIKQALAGYASPPGNVTPKEFSAFDVFCGYLVLDALIANSDRHDGNWAVLTPPPGQALSDALCGSYDHASSLGFNLSDDERERRLGDGTTESWAQKGKARQFERERARPTQTLVELARTALAGCPDAVRQHWLDTVSSPKSGAVQDVLQAAPGLSEVTITFTHDVIMTNRRRLLDAP